jgi:hypothetical protein
MRAAPDYPRLLWLVAFLLLAAFAVYTAVVYYPAHWSMDLYHPWGIPRAHEALGRATNPYADTARYGAYLQEMAGAVPDKALRWVREFWRHRIETGIEPTATPFFYASHALAPRDFQAFHLLHTVLEYGAIVWSVLLLARLRGIRWLPALCAVALSAGAFNPFVENVRVGNVSGMQLAVLTAMIAIAHTRLYDRSVIADRGFLALLALFVLFKPNTVLIAAGLAAHYAVVAGPRRLLAGSAIAAAAALAAAALSAAYFGSASVWLDWLRYLQGVNGGTLVYALDKGNIALPVFLFERTDAFAPQTWATMLAAAFALLLIAYATGHGREPQRIVPVVRAWLADPWIAASVPALAMFAASPLLWPHYLVFALIPIAWLAAPPGRPGWAAACAMAAFLCMSLVVIGPLVYAGHGSLAYDIMSFAWTLLLPAAFARLSRAAREAPA